MRDFRFLAVLAACIFLNPAARADQDEPINTQCPIGKEPIARSAGTVEHDGHVIGLCCPACGRAFLAWDESRRDAFVAQAMRDGVSGLDAGVPKQVAASRPVETVSASYPLDVCIVGQSKLGSMGDPVVRTYGGREVRFCCAGCIARFEADEAGYFEKIDALIIKDQLRYYPTDRCVVTGEPLVEDGKDIAVDMVYGNRLVRLCCNGCKRKFKAEPGQFIATLDKAAADAQRKDYPLDTCVVAGGALGSMGAPTEMVVAGRLLRFCCAGCEPRVKADPAQYLAAIDEAWKAKGRFAGPAE